MIRPTVRALVLFGGGLVAALLPAFGQESLWTAWLAFVAAFILLIAADTVMAMSPRRLTVELTVPEQLYIGEHDPLELRLEAAGRGEPLAVELQVDLDDELEPQPRRRVDVAGGGVVVEIPLVPRRRGIWTVRAAWTRWTGPLGLISRTRRFTLDESVPVVPNQRAVRAAALRFFTQHDFLAGVKMQRYIGDGSEFDRLHEFMPGFDSRSIDWRATARHRKLMCREYREERNHQIVIAFDTGHLMGEPVDGMPRLDHAVGAGLLLAYCGLKTGDRVSMFAFDETVRMYSGAQSGIHAYPVFRQRTAELEYGTGETNFTLGMWELSVRLKRRALVVVLTEFSDTITAELMTDNLTRLARRHLVLFVTLRDEELEGIAATPPDSVHDLNRAVVAGDFLRERAVVHKKLMQRGIHCLDVAPERLSTELVGRYLQIKRRELI